MYTYIINITLSYKRTPRTEMAYTNYFTNSLSIFIGKTLVLSSGILFTHLSINRKLYCNSSLYLTSTSL